MKRCISRYLSKSELVAQLLQEKQIHSDWCHTTRKNLVFVKLFERGRSLVISSLVSIQSGPDLSIGLVLGSHKSKGRKKIDE